MSAAESATPKPTATPAGAVELTAEGLQWMLLCATVERIDWDDIGDDRALRDAAARGAACDVWLNAYDAAPEAVRQTLTHSVMATAAGNAWVPAIRAALAAARLNAAVREVDTPLRAFVIATGTGAGATALSDAAVKRLFRVLQRCGLFAATNRRLLKDILFFSTLKAPRAFALLIAEPSADAALSGPTRCNAGDAHNPPRHHSVRSADERGVIHSVLWSAAAGAPAVWSAFSDARLPFGARAMDEEWAYELTGPCGCAGLERISVFGSPLHAAIECGNDKAGEWLAVRLPPKRLNERIGRNGDTPLIAALRRYVMLPHTIAALLSRVPDVDLTLRAKWYDEKEYTAAEWIVAYPPRWLPSHLAAELKLKTQQFGAQYLPSAAGLCVEVLFVRAGVPRELVCLVLQYTALPQPNRWLTAPATPVAC